MFNLETGSWEDYIIDKLDIDKKIFLDVTQPGSISGYVRDDIIPGTSQNRLKVIRSAYDTSSEIAAIPVSKQTLEKNWVFLCCGTTGTVGIVSDTPIIGEKGFKYEFGNEGGLENTFNFLKNFTCMWIMENCRNRWNNDESREISWEEIEKSVCQSADNNIFIDVDDGIFSSEASDMPSRIIRYCRQTGQAEPRTMGEISRCVFESYVLKIVTILKKLEDITGRKMEVLHMIGGGSKNRTFCQWVSDASGLPLIAGPAETTSSGNILIQMKADCEISDLKEGRVILNQALDLKHHEPVKNEKWEDKIGKYNELIIA
jgi:sugar (pentulose or hexulose) kinase